MAENQINNVLEIDKKPLWTDKVVVKKLDDIKKYLLETFEVSDKDVDKYAQQVSIWAQQIADSINNNLQNRKLTVDNLRVSDDKLVKQYVANAESQIASNITELWDNINKTLASLATNIWNLSPKDIRLDESNKTMQSMAEVDKLTN